ncbi:LAQU0S06e00694g1_1 [Lachancea quebecensis]|uniref:LAQU0S06e00694g1_1 n=1 Tax=Lachancea quebecensis TaxID=1654605 RepID=A0A0P1KR91_9SACH|nr:LAQU0S06e00694g1_1 [Lachancea quebecensis]
MTSKNGQLQRSLSSLSSHIHGWNEVVQPNKPGPTRSKKRRIEGGEHPKEQTALRASEEWYSKHKPQNLQDLALHKQKLKDVRDTLQQMVSGESEYKILLLTGPAGCSKSTSVHLLSKELVQNYREMAGPTLQMRNSAAPSVVEYDSSNFSLGSSKLDHFDEFLCQSMYKIGPNLTIILIEDFPNVFNSQTRTLFQQSLLRWLYSSQKPLPPIVISLTECEIQSTETSSSFFSVDTQFICETVLGREVLNHPGVKRIKYNPINKTLLKKHLNNVCAKERKAFFPGKWEKREAFIKSIIEHCGDIRSAISALQLWAESSAQSSFGIDTREQSVSYFHGLGKLLYGSKDTGGDNNTINDLLTSNSLMQSDNLRLGILENYSTFNRKEFPLGYAMDIVDSLSVSDTMYNMKTAQSLGEALEYPYRTVRHRFASFVATDSKTSPPSHNRTVFPRESKVRSLVKRFLLEANEYTLIELNKYGNSHSFRDVVLYFAFYAPFIRKRLNFKRRTLVHFLESMNGSAEQKSAIENNQDALMVNDATDVLDRVGGEIGMVNASHDLAFAEETSNALLASSKLQAFSKLQESYFVTQKQLGNQNDTPSFDDEPLDPIIESDDGSENFSDDDDEIYDLLASQSPRKQ